MSQAQKDKLAELEYNFFRLSNGSLPDTFEGEGGVLELAEEPHLHFEMKVGGEDADPLEYFSKSSLEILARKPEKVYED